MKQWRCQSTVLKEYEALRDTHRRVLIVLPTGGGKTVVAAVVIRTALGRGERVLFVAHTREIVEQAHDKLVRWGTPAGEIGVIMSRDERTDPEAPVQVATIQTISRREHPPADLIIVDEAHHAAADSYKALLAIYPGARVLGLTATAERHDGRGLGARGLFEVALTAATPMDLILEKHLAMPKVWTVGKDKRPDLRGVKTVAGDYDKSELERRVTRRGLVGSLVEHHAKHAKGRTTVVYAVTKRHARQIARRFRKEGRDVELLFGIGDTDLEERRRILARLHRGEDVVVVNVGVLTEGWDCPAAKCCVLARPTRSWTLHTQMVGRFLRPWKGVAPVILDHAGNVLVHNLPYVDHPVSLHAKSRRGTGRPAPAKMCPAEGCGAVVPTGVLVCPECGHEFEIKREPEQRKGELEEVVASEARKSEMHQRIKDMSKERGFGDKWVEKVCATFAI